jgi:hypothetical protein
MLVFMESVWCDASGIPDEGGKGSDFKVVFRITNFNMMAVVFIA